MDKYEKVSLIGLSYRFTHRSSTILPYWLEQNVEVHLCTVLDDPDGLKEQVLLLNRKFPKRIILHKFTDLKPFQRAQMYYRVIPTIKTKVVAFMDMDIIPPPNYLEQVLVQLKNGIAVTSPRVSLADALVGRIVKKEIQGYNNIVSIMNKYNHPRFDPNEAKHFYGYFQIGMTDQFKAASPNSQDIGVDQHDCKLRDNLKKMGVKILVLSKHMLLHLTHPKNHKKSTQNL